MPACLSQRSIPPGALRVGVDADGEEIYAGRAHHEGHITPAKVIPSKNACYISFRGEEILKDQFEVRFFSTLIKTTMNHFGVLCYSEDFSK